MPFPNPFKRRQPGASAPAGPAPAQTPPKKAPSAPAGQPQAQTPPNQKTSAPSPQSTTGGPPNLNKVQNGNVTLVTYSPEEALMQVQEERDKVAFGQSKTQGLMSNFNQFWSIIGPLLFAAGTIGEIFLVLWDRQKSQDPFEGFVIIVVSMIAEGSLLAVSFSSKLLRNRADKHPTGWTRRETKKLADIKNIWWLLSSGVAATQIAFIMSQTKADDIGGFWGLAAIAIVRAAVAMVADYYTAYISEEKPPEAEAALEQQDQQTEFTAKMLERKAKEVTIINEGAIQVQEAAQHAAIKQDRTAQQAEMDKDNMATERELRRLENANKIEKLKAKYQEEAAWSELQVASMRAMRDKITRITINELGEGDKATKEVTSTLHYLIAEVQDLKGHMKKEPTTGQLPPASSQEEV